MILEVMRIIISPEIRRRIKLSGAKEKVRTRQAVHNSLLILRRAASHLLDREQLRGEYDVNFLSVSGPFAYPTYFPENFLINAAAEHSNDMLELFSVGWQHSQKTRAFFCLASTLARAIFKHNQRCEGSDPAKFSSTMPCQGHRARLGQGRRLGLFV